MIIYFPEPFDKQVIGCIRGPWDIVLSSDTRIRFGWIDYRIIGRDEAMKLRIVDQPLVQFEFIILCISINNILYC
jgi:hypothetical protein